MANQPPPTWQDKFFLATFQQDSNPQLPTRRLVRIVSPLTVTDDATDGVTEISGGGGTTLQIEYASSVLPARAKLQILGNAKAADNSGNNSTDLTIGGLIEYASSTLPQRSKIQLLGTVSVADNPGNDSTDVTVAGGAGGSLYGPFGSRPGSAATGTQYVPSDGPVTFIFDGTVWRPIISGSSLVPPPAASGWSTASGGTSGSTNGTISDAEGTLLLTPNDRDTLFFPPSPTGVEFRAVFDQSVNPAWTDFSGANPGFGIVVYNTAVTGTHKAYWRFGNYYDSAGVQHVQIQQFTGTAFPYGAGASPVDKTGTPPLGGKYQYLRAVFNSPSAGNLSFFISANGIDWALVHTETTPFEDTPVSLKFGVTALSANPLVSLARVYSMAIA